MSRLNRASRWLATAVAASLLAACGSKPGTLPPGAYAVSLVGTHSELDGEWVLALEANGQFRIELDGRAAVNGIYDLDGDKVYFTDQGGPMKCASDIARGLYAWEIDDGQLRLRPLTDNCLGRRGILGSKPLASRDAAGK